MNPFLTERKKGKGKLKPIPNGPMEEKKGEMEKKKWGSQSGIRKVSKKGKLPG